MAAEPEATAIEGAQEGVQEVLSVGTVVADRYRILDVAGHGGMGVVYKAQHIHMSRTIALKMLLREVSSDMQAFRRFQQEARAASLLSHPHIVGIHDFDVLPDKQAYLAMDYLDGISLQELIREQGALSLPRFLHIFGQACDALGHAHQHGVVHRDIKPSNLVLVERDGDRFYCVIVDFGLVKLMSNPNDQKLTSTNMLVGSPLYMSPEQCRGLDLDHRTDIYSLGCVMYEALTGFPPFVGDTALDTLYKHIADVPVPMAQSSPDVYVPPSVERVIMRALSKSPDQRQQSMAQLRKELEEAAAQPSDPDLTRSGQIALPGRNSHAPAQLNSARHLNESALRLRGELEPLPPPSSSRAWVVPLVVVCAMSALVICVLLSEIQKKNREIALEQSKINTIEHSKQITGTGAKSVNAPNAVASVAASKGAATSTKPAAAANATKADSQAERKKVAASSQHGEMSDVEKSALVTKEQLAQDRASSAFDSQDWHGARDNYAECLQMQEKLFGKESSLLVPVLARLTVCSDAMQDEKDTVKYFNRFVDMYDDNPGPVASDAQMLSHLAMIGARHNNYSVASKLQYAAITAHDQVAGRADDLGWEWRMHQAYFLFKSGKIDDCKEQLKQIVQGNRPLSKFGLKAGTILWCINQGKMDAAERTFFAGANDPLRPQMHLRPPDEIGQGAGPGSGGPQLGGPQMGGPQMGGAEIGGPQMGGPWRRPRKSFLDNGVRRY